MFGEGKRRAPFGGHDTGSGLSSKCLKDNPQSIYEETLKKMMEASMRLNARKQEAGWGSASCPSGEAICCVRCSDGEAVSECSYCGHKLCEMCCRQCDMCQDVFCTTCSTPNYDLREDRTFCLECNVEVRRQVHSAGEARDAYGRPLHTQRCPAPRPLEVEAQLMRQQACGVLPPTLGMATPHLAHMG
eukprot:jgi/Mesvir1/18538/Mv11543-RA.1